MQAAQASQRSGASGEGALCATRVAVVLAGWSPDGHTASLRDEIVARWPGGAGGLKFSDLAGDAPTGLGLALRASDAPSGVLVIGARADLRSLAPRLAGMGDEAGVGLLVLSHGAGAPLPLGPSQHAVELHAGAPGGHDASAAAGALWALCRLRPALLATASELRLEAQVRGVASRQLDEQQIEQHLAAAVQREFLPRDLPAPPGLRLGALFRPKAGLSGDFYDARRLDEHHTAFFLADACGHGVPAALLMMLMSKLLPMKEIHGSSYRVLEPGEALTRLNAAFAERKGEVSALVSAAYGVIDGRDGRVRLASAGHPEALVLREGAGGRLISGSGPLLGTLDDFEYTQSEDVLAPGEVLLVHSDGLPPALGLGEGPEILGAEAVQRLAANAREFGVSEAALNLGAAIDLREGSLHQHDDITALLVWREAGAPGT